MGNKKVRHILGLSGGKDSTALALYLKDRVPDIEYFFCDTHKELPETYAYLKKLEILLRKKITFLESERGFDHWLSVYGGFLPSPQARWCTKQLKIIPFEKFVGGDDAISYIALRADEDRIGYISTKPNIKPVFPFMKDGLIKSDIINIIDRYGIGLPDYYKWRSRSGCYFCFFQRKIEWVKLHDNHPKLFEKAVAYEQKHSDGRKFFWSQDESLTELTNRREKIIFTHDEISMKKIKYKSNSLLCDTLAPYVDGEKDEICFTCHL